jgi:hypothetical protein
MVLNYHSSLLPASQGRVHVYVHLYQWYTCTMVRYVHVRTYYVMSQLLYTCTMLLPVYVHAYTETMVHVYSSTAVLPWSRECCSRRTARTRGTATSQSASTATRGSSTSAWCAPGLSAMSTRAVAPRRDWQRRPTPVKAAKCADQDNFIPFFLETGGCVNKSGPRLA